MCSASLQHLCENKQLIVVDAEATVHQAARELRENRVGALVVEEQGRVVGTMTHRDLILRVFGKPLDLLETMVRDVMTPSDHTLSFDASVEEVVALMKAQRVRLIPLVRGSRAVGVVTLDDLLMAGAIDAWTAAEIIRAELEEMTGTGSVELPRSA